MVNRSKPLQTGNSRKLAQQQVRDMADVAAGVALAGLSFMGGMKPRPIFIGEDRNQPKSPEQEARTKRNKQQKASRKANRRKK